MEKQDHKKELNTSIHPTLAVYLSGNFNDPINSFDTNASSNRGESAKPNRCEYFKKLHKNRVQSSSVIGGNLG